jgi:hypothetical protein
MKKTLIVLAVLLINSIAGIQQATAQRTGQIISEDKLIKSNPGSSRGVQWGIRAGLNLPTFEGSEWGPYTGFHVGVIVDIPLSSNWYIQPGLYFENKGASSHGAEGYGHVGMLCFDEQVLMSYRLSLSKKMKLHLNAGHFAGIGVFGTTTIHYGEERGNVDTFDDLFSRFDAGVSLGTGLSIGHIYFGLKYDLGMINILSNSDDYSVKTNTFGLTLGYNF